jgi:hemolysin D
MHSFLTLIKKSIRIWRQASKDESTQKRFDRTNDELAFLPAAIEVMETPPPKAARYISWTIIFFFVVAIVWSILGTMDKVAVALGRIVPNGNIKVVQALETAKVKSILVTEGMTVSKGDKLIELDPTDPEVDRQQVLNDLLASRLQIVRLNVTLQILSQKLSLDAFRINIKKDSDFKLFTDSNVELQEAILKKDVAVYLTSFEKLNHNIQQKKSSVKVADSELENSKRLHSLYQEQLELSKQLYSIGSISVKEWLESKEKYLEAQGKLISSKNRLNESQELVKIAVQELDEFKNQFRSEKLQKLEEIKKDEENLELALRKTTERENNRYLLSPVDGIVHQLKLHTIGAVVAPADTLLNIIPQDSGILVEAMLDNKDVGFVKVGDEVAIKIDSFSYTKYGYIKGKISNIGADAVADEKKGFLYPVKISLAESTVLVKDTMVPLVAGMTVSADIKTGSRRVIDYFITNFLEYQDETFRER